MLPSATLKKNTVGNIRWDKDKKTAVIRVLDPADYKIPFDDILKDIEFTVVHELIHLEMSPVLADLNRTDANRMEEEYAVNHMTDALLKLDRGDKVAPLIHPAHSRIAATTPGAGRHFRALRHSVGSRRKRG